MYKQNKIKADDKQYPLCKMDYTKKDVRGARGFKQPCTECQSDQTVVFIEWKWGKELIKYCHSCVRQTCISKDEYHKATNVRVKKEDQHCKICNKQVKGNSQLCNECTYELRYGYKFEEWVTIKIQRLGQAHIRGTNVRFLQNVEDINSPTIFV